MDKMDNMPGEDYFNWVSTTEYTGPYGATMKIYVKEGKEDQYKELITKIFAIDYENERKVDGVYQDMNNPCIFWFNDKWTSPQAQKKWWTLYKDDEDLATIFGIVDGYQIGLYKLKEF